MPTPNAAPDALSHARIERFRGDLTTLTGEAVGKIGLAVSGGPDSVAMLLLAAAAFPGQVAAATVDHRLRPESFDEARFVAALCTDLGVTHDILTVEIVAGRNVSDAARTARYAALVAWQTHQQIDWIATAHHADDQLETMIMRLNRGAGVAGLSAIRRRHGTMIRPLLGWRHAELVAIVADAGIDAVDDPSNHDDRYDRARLRKALAGTDWLDPLAATRSAGWLADADAALDWAASRIEPTDAAMADLPDELARRVLHRCLAEIVPDIDPRGDALMRVLRALQAGNKTMIGDIVCTPGARWCFKMAPPRRS